MRKELVTQLMRSSGSEKMCMTIASPAADRNTAIRIPGPRLHRQRHPNLETFLTGEGDVFFSFGVDAGCGMRQGFP